MAFLRLIALSILVSTATVSRAQSSYLYLFTSSDTRAKTGLARQKARRTLVLNAHRRIIRLDGMGAVSRDEVDNIKAALELSALDLEIAEIRAKQAAISLRLARALDRAGQAIPVCKRQKQKDEDTVSKLLDRPAPQSLPSLPEPEDSGTRLQVQEAPEPDQPDPPDPIDVPDPPDPIDPPGTDGGSGGAADGDGDGAGNVGGGSGAGANGAGANGGGANGGGANGGGANGGGDNGSGGNGGGDAGNANGGGNGGSNGNGNGGG